MFEPTTVGGLRKHVEQLARHLETPCVILTSRDSEAYAGHWQAAVVHWSETPHRTLAAKTALFVEHMRNLRQLMRVSKSLNVAIVHIQDVEPLSTAVWWHFFKRRFKVVMSVHDLSCHRPYSHGLARIEFALRRYLYKHADALCVFSEYGARQLIEDIGVGEERVYAMPLGVCEPLPEDPPDRRVRPTRPVFLLLGRYRPNRGFEILCEAFLRLREAGYPALLRIAGPYHPEDMVARTRARYDECGFSNDIEFINRFIAEDEIDGLMRSSDVMVLPYTSYGSQSAVLYLAYAYNMPIVASRVGGLPEMLEADGTGVLVEPGDVEDLARGMRGVLDRWEEIARAEPHALLESKYSWKRIAEITDSAYARLSPDSGGGTRA